MFPLRSLEGGFTAKLIKPLNCAALKGHAAVTKELIATRCNVDLQEDNGCTNSIPSQFTLFPYVLLSTLVSIVRGHREEDRGWTPT